MDARRNATPVSEPALTVSRRIHRRAAQPVRLLGLGLRSHSVELRDFASLALGKTRTQIGNTLTILPQQRRALLRARAFQATTAAKQHPYTRLSQQEAAAGEGPKVQY